MGREASSDLILTKLRAFDPFAQIPDRLLRRDAPVGVPGDERAVEGSVDLAGAELPVVLQQGRREQVVILTLLNLIASGGCAVGEIMGAGANRDVQDRPP